jgi:hypothetical protein
MLNLSCRNYKLIIDNLDCTELLTNITGNYEHYQSGTGYVKISASLTLQRLHFGWTENLDHRTNTRWARGKQISFQIANENGVLTASPILGHLYILSSQYDGINALKIEAGCILSLLDFRTPAGDGVCFSLGETKSLTAIANQLLEESGVPSYSILINGQNLSAPLQKLTNESYIQLFGKLCFANNYLAYQDKLGVVRVKKITTNPSSLKDLIVGESELSYSPLQGNEQPAEIYRISGVVKTVIDVTGFQSASVTESFGTFVNQAGGSYNGLLERKYIYEKEINKEDRTVYSKIYTQQLAAKLLPAWFPSWFSLISWETTETTNYHEKTTNPTKCSDTDEGKLLTTIETVKSPLILVLNEFYVRLKKLTEDAGGQFILVGQLNSLTARKTITTYDFQLDEIDSESLEDVRLNSRKLGKVTKVSTTWQPKGTLVYEALTDDQDDTTWLFFDPQTLVKTEIVTEEWIEVSPNQWSYFLERKQASFINKPTETVDLMLRWRDDGVVISSYDFFWELQTVERTNGIPSYFANQPPSPEYFPSTEAIIENQLIEIEEFPSYASEFKERIKEITVDSGFLTSNSQARNIAQLEANLTWGKYLGNSFTTALFNELLGLKPLDAITWQESTGSVHKFLIDGAAIAFESQQLAFSADGIWVSQVSDGVDIPINSVMGLPRKYRLIGASNSRGKISFYPYSLGTITDYLITGLSINNGTIDIIHTEPLIEFRTLSGSVDLFGNNNIVKNPEFRTLSGSVDLFGNNNIVKNPEFRTLSGNLLMGGFLNVDNQGQTDPYLNDVVLYLKGDGANNSTNIVDSSPNPKTITVFGDTKISTTQSKYGGSSIYFDGIGDYLEVIQPSLFSFPGDFTIECWFWTSIATGDQCLLNINSYQNGVLMRPSSTGGLIYAQGLVIYPPGNPSLSTWHHLTISRQGTSVYSFLDGVATTTKTISGTVNTGTSAVKIGSPNAGQFSIDFNGYIDSLRITKGTARYTANFNPETDTYLAY